MLVSIHKHYYVLFFLFMVLVQQVSAREWTLEECIDSAMVNNKRLKMAKNNVDLNDQRNKEALANYLPKLNFNSDYKYYIEQPTQLVPMSMLGGPQGKYKEVQMGVPHNINANVQLSMPIYNARISGGIQMSEIASDISKIQFRKSEEDIFIEISNLFYNAVVLEKQINFVDSNILNMNKLLLTVKLLQEQSLLKSTDVNKTELQLAGLKTQRNIIQSKYTQVLNLLKFSMGIPYEKDISIKTEIIQIPSQRYETVKTVDMQLLGAQQKMLQTELKTIKNSGLPSVSVFGAYGKQGYGYDKSPNDFLKFYDLSFAGVQLSFPIFNGTVTHRKIKQKKIEIRNNQIQEDMLNEQNLIQLENARNIQVTALQTIENSLKQIQLSRKVYDQTILQQKEGTANLTEVLLSDNTLRESQQNYLSALVDYLKSELEMKKLSGNILNK